MREVTRPLACLRHQFLLAVEQGVDVAGERLDLVREGAVQPLGSSAVDGIEAVPELLQGAQTDSGLKPRADEEQKPQDGERDPDIDREGSSQTVDIGVVGATDRRKACEPPSMGT